MKILKVTDPSKVLITDAHLFVMRESVNGKTVREIAAIMDRSIHWITILQDELRLLKLIHSPKKKEDGKRHARDNALTPKGRRFLEKQGLLKNGE